MNDIVEVSQLILRERQGRDRGWWQQMRDCFDPQASVRLSWFNGTGADFVTESEAMSDRGDKGLHRMSPPVVHLDGDRAVVEVGAAIEFGVVLDGVEAVLTSYARLLYRTQKRSDSWRIVSLDPIYERDSVVPTVPGAALRLDPGALSKFRQSYRLLAYNLSTRGYTVATDLYGDDQPESVAGPYGETFAWLGETPR